MRGDFNFDPGKATLVLKVDGAEQWHETFKWDDGKKYQFDVPQKWATGRHELVFELHPLVNAAEQKTSVDLTIQSVAIQGPMEEKFWPVTPEYRRFFTRDDVPKGDAERREYAREVLTAFTTKAFRRPADNRTIERLVKIAEAIYSKPDKTFEQGIAQAMVAVISSPRFLFRIEKAESQGPAGGPFCEEIDEYSLASRLSYFLWSTMPDEELFSLAQRGELRKNFASQVKRLMDDPRSATMIRNFAGQWLQLRDMDGIAIDSRVVLARDNGTEKELLAVMAQVRARQQQLDDQIAKGTRPTTGPASAVNQGLASAAARWPGPLIGSNLGMLQLGRFRNPAVPVG